MIVNGKRALQKLRANVDDAACGKSDWAIRSEKFKEAMKTINWMEVGMAMALGVVLCGCGESAQEKLSAEKISILEDQVAQLEQSQRIETGARLGFETNLEENIILSMQINDQEKAGTITHDRAQYLMDVLFRKIPLYVAPSGRVTTNQIGE